MQLDDTMIADDFLSRLPQKYSEPLRGYVFEHDSFGYYSLADFSSQFPEAFAKKLAAPDFGPVDQTERQVLLESADFTGQ